jgi:glucose-6-phosphate isomerase
MSTALTLDYTNMLAPSLGGGGVEPDRLAADLAERFAVAHASVEADRTSGRMGFFELPYDEGVLSETREVADEARHRFDNFVVLGIGGSALGATTIRDALAGPSWNEWSDQDRGGFPRLYVVDNADAATLGELLSHLDASRTLFNVVSKSGSTAETIASYLVVEEHLRNMVGEDEARGHFLFTTDAERGPLRRVAEEEGIPTLEIPENVGGRFSVLSPVGVLPAAVTGVDVDALMAGAAAMDARCRAATLSDNPAGLFATLLHSADTETGRPIHVLMPYADRLRSLGLWFQQLWAESLGKAVDLQGKNVQSGPTPLAALGASDQHAQVQLFIEGPHDKVVVLVAAPASADLVIPSHRKHVSGMGYLAGHTVGELLDAERRATAEALRQRGRPNMTVELGPIDAHGLGQILMMLQIATVYAGALYGVDPLVQPGVELGKELTYGLLGREGYESSDLPAPDPRWRV